MQMCSFLGWTGESEEKGGPKSLGSLSLVWETTGGPGDEHTDPNTGHRAAGHPGPHEWDVVEGQEERSHQRRRVIGVAGGAGVQWDKEDHRSHLSPDATFLSWRIL